MALRVDIKKDFGGFVLQTKFETDGGVMGILGASGCGKSMTLRCIAGIVKPDEGRIELDGTVFFDSDKRINLKPQERHVGLLFQNYALFPNMTVQQNLMMGLKPYEKDKKKAKAEVEQMIRKFYLIGLEKHKPFQLSGGQQQRVALARILLSKPHLLMLDEPFSALDEFLRWNLELELSEVLKEFSGNTLFVSHNRAEIYRICDRVCVMEQGKSNPVIPVKQLFEDPDTRAAAYLSGCKNFSRAHAKGEREIFADDWGVALESEEAVPEGFSCIGVRSHYIYPVEAAKAPGQKNTFLCSILKVVEDVFSIVIMLRPIGAKNSGFPELTDRQEGQIRMEVTKECWKEFCEKEHPTQEVWVQIQTHDIMLLR
ncbi:MAG: ATP-binding cassette domain-containing protein [Eubacteriales bacterium]|nr:ATP-binding cassette domain-containing protein [Eubacteriales bacterium]